MDESDYGLKNVTPEGEMGEAQNKGAEPLGELKSEQSQGQPQEQNQEQTQEQGQTQGQGQELGVQSSTLQQSAPVAEPSATPDVVLEQALPTVQPVVVPVVVKERGIWRFLRVVIWLLVIISLAVGVGLVQRSMLSSAYVDGSSTALQQIGWWMIWVGGGVGIANLIWGTIRWVRRGVRQHWRVGRVIGKLIGGGIWRTLVIAPIALLALIALSPVVAGWVKDAAATKRAEVGENALSKVAADFKAGKITRNEYINLSLQAAYAEEKLPEQYKADDLTMKPDLLEEVTEHFDELSLETIHNVCNAMLLGNVRIGEDASGNVSTGQGIFTNGNAYATAGNTATLNKVKLSSGGHFLIFYTDTGDNKISDTKAAEIGETMEGFITKYETNLGLKYHTTQKHYGDAADEYWIRVTNLLDANGIDPNVLFSAMPIYFVNPYGQKSRSIATYTGLAWNDFWTLLGVQLARWGVTSDKMTEEEKKHFRELVEFYATSPMLPFINILPDNVNEESFDLVLAHEFGHHYAANYCQDNFNKQCGTSKFINETVANYMAVMATGTQPEKNLIARSHHDTYIKNVGESVYNMPGAGDLNGYTAAAFMYQYSEIVPGGKKIVLDAMTQEDPYDYFYAQAGREVMGQVLGRLAVANLTNDYNGKNAFRASILPAGTVVPCTDFCTMEYKAANWPNASIRYFYFPIAEYKDVTVKAKNKLRGSEYEFRLVGQKGGAWTELPLATENGWYKIAVEDYADEYETVALAVADVNRFDTVGEGWVMDISQRELEEFEVEEMEDEESGEGVIDGFSGYFGTYGDCVWFYTDSLIEAGKRVMGVFKGIDTDLDAAIMAWDAEADSAKVEVGHRKVTLCGRRLSSAANFEVVKSSLRARGVTIQPFEYNESHTKAVLMVTYDPLSGQTSAKLLGQDTEGMSLVTMTIQ